MATFPDTISELDEKKRNLVEMNWDPITRIVGSLGIFTKIDFANRVVADEYAAVSAKIDALYGQQLDLPADYETTGMAKLRREAQARMLGNGLCTRPVELDCRMESACETCAYFRTGTEFLPILVRQRDHARDHGQADRAALFDGLIQPAGTGPATTERS